MMKRFAVLYICLHVALLACAQPQRDARWAVPVDAVHAYNLYRADSGVYRCAQPCRAAFSELSAMGITTVINLRYFDTDRCRAKRSGMQLFHVRMRAGKFDDSEVVAALRLIKDRKGAAAVHCRHGADRTGLIMALYRILFQGWDRESAIAELENGDYNFHPVFSNIPQYIREVDIDRLKELLDM